MRRIGLIGGVTWGATVEYYESINLDVQRQLGGHHSADMLIRSLDLQPLLGHAEDLPWVENAFRHAATDLCAGGAQVLGVASFTGHRYIAGLAGLAAPVVDLIDTIAARIGPLGIQRVALWATSYALGDERLCRRLEDSTGVELLPVPHHARAELDRIIFTELASRQIKDSSVEWLRNLQRQQQADGAQALLLATTDLAPMRAHLLQRVPILDAAEIHCTALVAAALA
jgi:aspartate racemase